MIISKQKREQLSEVLSESLRPWDVAVLLEPTLNECFNAVAELDEQALRNLVAIVNQETKARGL